METPTSPKAGVEGGPKGGRPWEDEGRGGPGMSRRRRLTICGVVLVVLVLGLALGLGLGLGLKHGGGGGGGEEPTPTGTQPPASPTPTAIWQPPVNASWQIVLSKTLKIDGDSPSVEPDVDVYDIDLFLHQNNTVINSLHKLGKRVICYFSAGSYEPNRPDSWQFQQSDLGSELEGWPGEHWLKLTSDSVRSIMQNRIKIASNIGCDAVDPDNVDGFQNTNGLGLAQADAVDFVNFLVAEAQKYNLGIGLKNAGDIISDVLPGVQFSVNEQCAEYDECDTFAAFVDADKPVFHIEYPSGAPNGVSAERASHDCTASREMGFSTVLKTMDLDGWVEYCNRTTSDTDVL